MLIHHMLQLLIIFSHNICVLSAPTSVAIALILHVLSHKSWNIQHNHSLSSVCKCMCVCVCVSVWVGVGAYTVGVYLVS